MDPLVASLLAALIVQLLDIEYLWAWTQPTVSEPLALQQKRRELQRVSRELAETPSTDHFAKWARLRRTKDALAATIAQLESIHKASTTRVGGIKNVRSLAKWLIQVGLLYLYRSRSAIELQTGVLPWPLATILAFGTSNKSSAEVISFLAWNFMVTSLLGRIVSKLRSGQHSNGDSQHPTPSAPAASIFSERGLRSDAATYG
ncbi:GET complex subunit get1 [Savitreella phatthalungensis]